MGAIGFNFETEGYDAKSVFNREYALAREEYGSDPYNGTISTTSYCGLVKLGFGGSKFKDSNLRKARKEVEKHFHDWVDKRDCKIINLGVLYWEVTSYKMKKGKSLTKAPRPTVVYEVHSNGQVFKYNKEDDAHKKAQEMASCGHNCSVVKTYEVPRVQAVTATYTTEVKKVTREHKKVPKGATVRAVNKYLVFGLAAE